MPARFARPSRRIADERRIHRPALGLRFELIQKRLRSGVRDRAEIFDQLAVCHADAGIGKSDRLRRVIRRDGHLQRRIRLRDFRAARLQKSQLLTRIRRVRDQLADEDLLVRVKRVDNEIEELRDLGLEFMFLGCSGRTHRAADSMDAARLRKERIFPPVFTDTEEGASAESWTLHVGSPWQWRGRPRLRQSVPATLRNIARVAR